MPETVFRALQALLALGVFAVGYWRWIRPRQATIGLQGTGLLLLMDLTFVGGLIGGAFWWANEPGSFAWTLPGLAARMLGAAGWAYAAAALLTLAHPTADRLRLMLVLLFVYLAPLVPSIIGFHLGRFDFGAPISYAFFIVVAGMLTSTIWYLVKQPAIESSPARDKVALSPITSGWFFVVASALGAWGLALFFTDAGPSPLIWVWPGDPLSSQLIGVMLLSIAAGAIFSRRSPDRARLMFVFMLVYGLGVVLGTISFALVGAPMRLAYLGVFALIGAASATLLVPALRSART